jgi:hypothetical protein
VRSIAARVRTIAPTREAQISRSPILEVFNLGFCNSLLHKDSNPTIFRVSRILLKSINRPVNTEETHAILEKNLRVSRKRLFGFILFLYFIL